MLSDTLQKTLSSRLLFNSVYNETHQLNWEINWSLPKSFLLTVICKQNDFGKSAVFLKFVFIIFYDYSIIFWNMDLENTNLDRINDILSLIKDDLLHKEYLRSKSINTYFIFAWSSFLFSKIFICFYFLKNLSSELLFSRFFPVFPQSDYIFTKSKKLAKVWFLIV